MHSSNADGERPVTAALSRTSSLESNAESEFNAESTDSQSKTPISEIMTLVVAPNERATGRSRRLSLRHSPLSQPLAQATRIYFQNLAHTAKRERPVAAVIEYPGKRIGRLRARTLGALHTLARPRRRRPNERPPA